MSPLAVILMAEIANIYFNRLVEAETCPSEWRMEINEKCYRFSTSLLRFSEIVRSCHELGGRIISSYKDKAVLQKIEETVQKFILSKLEKGYWWLGLKMDDTNFRKPVENRQWTFDYDESHFIQKDYPLWDVEGGPTEKGLACAAFNASLGFKVKAVDCGAARIPVICMMKEGEKCKHEVVPYMKYGPHCLASINGALEYNKIHGACSPNTPTPYKDEEMKRYVTMAAKNSFIGGGLFQNIIKVDGKFVDREDFTEPDEDMWEEGEPSDEYDCVGLSLQEDSTLKLKTINCEFLAASFCAYGIIIRVTRSRLQAFVTNRH